MTTPELSGQIKAGLPMTERDCFGEAMRNLRKLREAFQTFANRQERARTPFDAMMHLRSFRDAIRGLSLLRADMRWLLTVRVLEKLEDQMQAEFGTRVRTSLFIAARTERWKARAAALERMEYQLGKLFDRAVPRLLILPRGEFH